MIFWSVQDYPAWEQALKVGYLTGDAQFALEPESYAWMVRQMQNRLNIDYDFWPVWMWDERPDLRKREYGQGDLVLLRMELNRERVLASDYFAWHFVLNGSALTLYPDEEVKLEASWERVFDLDLLRQYPDWLGDVKPQYTAARVPVTHIKLVKRFVGR